MNIDNKIIEQARHTDMITFLEQRYGFTFTRRGNTFRCRQHPSFAVKNDRLSWFWHSKGFGGFGVLDYLIKVERMEFREAVGLVCGISTPTARNRGDSPIPEQPKILVLPERAGIPLLLYDYLCVKRGIDSEIVYSLINEGKLYEDRRGNVVFVGYDENKKPRFATLRGTRSVYRGDCAGSDKRYGFNMAAYAPSERLYLYESAIDLMSHASIVKADTGAWRHHHRLSLAGTTDAAMPFFLNQHEEVKVLVFSLDNDAAGREAAALFAEKYVQKGYMARIELPKGKDFNEDLVVGIKQLQGKRKVHYYGASR